MATWSDVTVDRTRIAKRLDAEYFRPIVLAAAEATRRGELLGDLADEVIHPAEFKREYATEGLRLLLAQNIKPNWLDLSKTAIVSESLRPLLDRSALSAGDVLITRTGANFGDAAVYLGSPNAAYAGADCLVVRNPRLPAGYLASFLTSRVGRLLMDRGSYGGGQPHISPKYLREEVRVPRLGTEVEAAIHDHVVEGYQRQAAASELLATAEKVLADGVGLSDWAPVPALSWEAPFSAVVAADRLDSDFFAPTWRRLEAHLGTANTELGDVADLRQERYRRSEAAISYVELGSVRSDGTAASRAVPGAAAPDRAQWIIRAGDVLAARVRPLRRLSCLVGHDQDGAVCSSGFSVLQPRSIPPEVLLVYLRNPWVAGLLSVWSRATMYPEVSPQQLLRLPVAVPATAVQEEVVEAVRAAMQEQAAFRSLIRDAVGEVDAHVRLEP